MSHSHEQSHAHAHSRGMNSTVRRTQSRSLCNQCIQTVGTTVSHQSQELPRQEDPWRERPVNRTGLECFPIRNRVPFGRGSQLKGHSENGPVAIKNSATRGEGGKVGWDSIRAPGKEGKCRSITWIRPLISQRSLAVRMHATNQATRRSRGENPKEKTVPRLESLRH